MVKVPGARNTHKRPVEASPSDLIRAPSVPGPPLVLAVTAAAVGHGMLEGSVAEREKRLARGVGFP